jgi:hypothetical protein
MLPQTLHCHLQRMKMKNMLDAQLQQLLLPLLVVLVCCLSVQCSALLMKCSAPAVMRMLLLMMMRAWQLLLQEMKMMKNMSCSGSSLSQHNESTARRNLLLLWRQGHPHAEVLWLLLLLHRYVSYAGSKTCQLWSLPPAQADTAAAVIGMNRLFICMLPLIRPLITLHQPLASV